MNSRVKALLGVSALALLTGAAPLVPAVLAPAAESFGLAISPLVTDAAAQESGEGEGEGEGATECTTEDGEGEGEEGGEDGEGEG